MTNFEKVAEILGVQIGKKFRIIRTGIEREFHFEADGLYMDFNGDIIHSSSVLYELLRGDYQISKWPEKGNAYYYPHFEHTSGFAIAYWRDYTVDKIRKSTVGIYKTKEQAKEKSRELGWIE